MTIRDGDFKMSNYNYNTLCHHGIKGQKWGIRRFQNEDGTLTAEGRKRYDVDPNGYSMSKKGEKLYKQDLKMNKLSKSKPKSTKVLGIVLGATVGAGAVYAATHIPYMKDHRVSSKEAANLSTILNIGPGVLAGVGAGVMGSVIHDKVNNKRVEKAKNYMNSILLGNKRKEPQPWDEKPTRKQPWDEKPTRQQGNI